MSRLATSFLIALIPITLVSLSLAQPSSSQQNTRTLLINVLDRDGNAVRDLSKGNFRVRLNGKPATVANASYSVAPRRTVVLLDMSGSMEGRWDATKWHIARQATEDMLRAAPKDAQVALLTFSDQVHDVFAFSRDRSAMLTWLERGINQRANVKGPTALYDAIVTAAKLLSSPQDGDAIYLVTDGGDNSSHRSAADTQRLLRRSEIRLYVFLFSEPSTQKERTGLDVIAELAVDSGGFVVGTRGRGLGAGYASSTVAYEYDERVKEKIRQCTQAVSIQINGFYPVQIETAAENKDHKVRVEIVDKTGAVRKDVAFTYQRVLPAAK